MEFLSCQEIRLVDEIAVREFGIPSLVLMENAGRGAADWIIQQKPQAVWLLCGTGNNGGDGVVIARHLAAAGIPTRSFVLGEVNRLTTDAAIHWRIVQLMKIPAIICESVVDFQQAVTDSNVLPSHLIVDALLGTGSQGTPRSPLSDAIRWANAQTARRIAIDIPTGLDGDSGVVSNPTFLADATLTFVAPKLGFVQHLGRPPLGELVTLSIGVGLQQVRSFFEQKNRSNSDKIQRSH